MFGKVIVIFLLIAFAKASDVTGRCHSDGDCTGLTKCSKTGFCVISNFKVGIIGFVGALIICAAFGACVYLNISYLIGTHIRYSEIALEQQKAKTNMQDSQAEQIDNGNNKNQFVLGITADNIKVF